MLGNIGTHTLFQFSSKYGVQFNNQNVDVSYDIKTILKVG